METSNWLPVTDGSSWDLAENPAVDTVPSDEDPSTPDLLWIYIAPFILSTGICGNALVLLVMSKGRMRGTSTCVYLLTMAIADLLVIITGVVPDWLAALRVITIKEVHTILCKTEKFLSYTSIDTSIWACVAFTIDRFVAVCFPMDSTQRCPPRNAVYYAAAAFLGAICKNLHVFATRGHQLVTKNNQTVIICGSPNKEFAYFEGYVRPWIAFTTVNLIPCIIIIFSNLFIVRAMIRLRRSKRLSVIVSSKDSSATFQMAVLSLSASICFLVCVTPSMVLLIGKPYWVEEPSYGIAKAVGNLIFYVNHSINFFLYCITGEKFRAELRALFSRSARPRSSIFRDSKDLKFANKLQTDRLSQVNGNTCNHYASAPCISKLGVKMTIVRGSTAAVGRTHNEQLSAAMGERMKASSDAMLLGSSNHPMVP